jgi:hypothetical protein
MAVVAGIGTWLLLSLVWSLLLGAFRALGGQLGVLTGLQPFRTIVQVPGWFFAVWMGWSVYATLA